MTNEKRAEVLPGGLTEVPNGHRIGMPARAKSEEVPVPTPQNPFRSPAYVARAMDVQPYTVRDWLNSGRLKGYKVDRQWKILHSEWVEFLQKENGPSGTGEG